MNTGNPCLPGRYGTNPDEAAIFDLAPHQHISAREPQRSCRLQASLFGHDFL